MSRRIYVIRHVAFEDLGFWEAPLNAYGAVRYFQAGVDDLTPCDADNPELLIVLGGPISVYETEQYSFIANEIELIRKRLQTNRPLLGICLGAQLMAAAAGARVYSSGVKEIGWQPIKLTSSGESSCLRHLATSNYTVLHWHGDTFDLPPSATLLASTNLVKHQAFAIGDKALALQFHVEADPKRFETWLIGHTCELANAGIKPNELRNAATKLPASLQINSERVLKQWLDQINYSL